ncbi:hypothetical protein ACVDG5_003965 [Mesorhizobium sp. ORM6]
MQTDFRLGADDDVRAGYDQADVDALVSSGLQIRQDVRTRSTGAVLAS